MVGPVGTLYYQRKPYHRWTLSTHGLLEQKYDEDNVINNIMPHYKFISKHGCLSNYVNQSERETVESERKVNIKSRPQDTYKQTAIDCLNNSTLKRLTPMDIEIKMDVKASDNLAAVEFSAETTQLIQRWKEIVKPGIYRMTGRKWKKKSRTEIST